MFAGRASDGLVFQHFPAFVSPPNLNLIERLWKLLKKEVLKGQHHQDFAKFRETIEGCLSDIPTEHKVKLATLLTHKFQTWDEVSLLND